jgi:hypothetical protein
MKPSVKRVKDLEAVIVMLEVDMDIATRELSVVNHNVRQFRKIKRRLLANIQILKQDRIVVIASEYKKIQEELGYVSENLIMYTNMKNFHQQGLAKKCELYKQYVSELDMANKILENEKVVVMFRKDMKDEHEG